VIRAFLSFSFSLWFGLRFSGHRHDRKFTGNCRSAIDRGYYGHTFSNGLGFSIVTFDVCIEITVNTKTQDPVKLEGLTGIFEQQQEGELSSVDSEAYEEDEVATGYKRKTVVTSIPLRTTKSPDLPSQESGNSPTEYIG